MPPPAQMPRALQWATNYCRVSGSLKVLALGANCLASDEVSHCLEGRIKIYDQPTESHRDSTQSDKRGRSRKQCVAQRGVDPLSAKNSLDQVDRQFRKVDRRHPSGLGNVRQRADTVQG